ncbi:hypothetical protein CRE_25313 [Caenorhabditis remanei]|uniref:RNA helicase n=1 Tax=Caenorhabditis remanei TaxID=31234 RepID=E3LSG9_CAERE|nr:hypothetical protein CRE_25313 [Caenorhabditis remanei]
MSDSSSSDGEDDQKFLKNRKKTLTKSKILQIRNKLKKKTPEEIEDNVEEIEEEKTFAELGVSQPLCDACQRLGWMKPSKIQQAALPHALQGKDVIGLAETGSGKTGAFAIPVLQSLLDHPQAFFCLVLTPTRELAFQIGQQFEALGSGIGLIAAVIVGGVDMAAQAMALARRPHIIVATPGRLVDHLENTKGFNLKALKFLIMDEADRILNMDFEVELDKILKVIPKERRTYLFSATMTKKVSKLERASLRDPARVSVSTRYKTVDNLKQHYIFIPNKYKETYLVYLLNEHAGNSAIVFCATCATAMQIAVMLRQLGMQAVPLHGQMSQVRFERPLQVGSLEKRLGSLNKFKSKARDILVCTDVAARGLDIPHVDMVINYDMPSQSKDYVHRVGRTARAGRSGLAITVVTQYDVEGYQKIEANLGKKLDEYKCVENEVMVLVERTQEALENAKVEMKEMDEKRKSGKKRRQNDDLGDTEENSGRFKMGIKSMGGGGGGGKKKKFKK